VIFGLAASLIEIDSVSVLKKGVGVSNSAGNRSTLENLLHHVFFASNGSVLFNLINVVLVRDVASHAGLAVTAVGHGGAVELVGTGVSPASTLVDSASLVSDVVVVDPRVRLR